MTDLASDRQLQVIWANQEGVVTAGLCQAIRHHIEPLDVAAATTDHVPNGVVEGPSVGKHQGHEETYKAL